MKKINYSIIPYLYFIAILIWVFMDNRAGGDSNPFVILLFTIPFLVQLFLRSKVLGVSLGAVSLFMGVWMLLAFLSDARDITAMNASDWRFLLVGGLFVVANIAMGTWIVINSQRDGQRKESRIA